MRGVYRKTGQRANEACRPGKEGAMRDREQRLREELEGCRQVAALDQAMIAAILEKTGEVTVSREAIHRHLQEKRQVRAEWCPEADSYRLWTEGAHKRE